MNDDWREKLVKETQKKLWCVPLFDVEGQRDVLREMLEEARVLRDDERQDIEENFE